MNRNIVTCPSGQFSIDITDIDDSEHYVERVVSSCAVTVPDSIRGWDDLTDDEQYDTWSNSMIWIRRFGDAREGRFLSWPIPRVLFNVEDAINFERRRAQQVVVAWLRMVSERTSRPLRVHWTNAHANRPGIFTRRGFRMTSSPVEVNQQVSTFSPAARLIGALCHHPVLRYRRSLSDFSSVSRMFQTITVSTGNSNARALRCRVLEPSGQDFVPIRPYDFEFMTVEPMRRSADTPLLRFVGSVEEEVIGFDEYVSVIADGLPDWESSERDLRTWVFGRQYHLLREIAGPGSFYVESFVQDYLTSVTMYQFVQAALGRS